MAWDILICIWQAVGEAVVQFTKVEIDINRPGIDVPQISKSPVTKQKRMFSIYTTIIPRYSLVTCYHAFDRKFRLQFCVVPKRA
jgi:hypothetical protein